MLWSNTRTDRRSPKSSLNCVPLEDRTTPAVTAVFNTNVLTVLGDGAANTIVVSADAAGSLQVTNNGEAVPIRTIFGSATRTNVTQISVDAKGGDDSVTLMRSLNTLDANGKLASSPNAVLTGGGGNDTLTPLIGGFVGGVPGNAIVGNVLQQGGSGNDTLVSGFGNDVMLGEGGNDTLVWNPGTLIDHYDGGSGSDTGVVIGNENPIGGSNADAFVLGQDPNSPGDVLFQRTNLVPFFITMTRMEKVSLQTQGGDDTITINDLSGTSVKSVFVDGGTGNDTIDGSAQMSESVGLVFNGNDGDDLLVGGAGKDKLDGGAGNDTLDVRNDDGKRDSLLGGEGEDTFVVNKQNRPQDVILDFEYELDEVRTGS